MNHNVSWTDKRQAFQWWCPKCGTGIRDPESLGNPYVCPNCDPHVTLEQRPRVREAGLRPEAWAAGADRR